MENWIGAYRLPAQLGLGDRGGGGELEQGGGGGGVSPIPGSTPSPGLLNMWNNIKVESPHGGQHGGMSTPGSIKGKGRQCFEIFLPDFLILV